MEAIINYPQARICLTLEDIHVLESVKSIIRHIKGVRSVRVEKPKTTMSEKEFYAKIDRSLASAKTKPLYAMQPGESGEDFLNRITSSAH